MRSIKSQLYGILLKMILEVENEVAMKELGAKIGAALHGGEVIELVGDVGAGKTTFVKGLAKGLRITEDVQSPSFTLSRVYEARDGLRLDHYDFYRLPDAGILEYELAESIDEKRAVTVVEWANIVQNILPERRITFTITPTSEAGRSVVIHGGESIIAEAQL